MPSTRREFLKQAGAVAAVGTAAASYARPAWAAAAPPNPAGANERFTIAVIGPGGQGTSVMTRMLETKHVDVAWVCDVDQKRLEKAAHAVNELAGATPKMEK